MPARRLVRLPRAQLSRIGVAAVAALCLGAQLSNVAHLALVRHVTCAEHGEVIDAPAAGHSPAHRTDVPLPDDAAPTASSGGGPIDGAHDHCALAEDRNTLALVVRAATSALCPAAPVASTPPRGSSPCLSPSALRLLAPKTSPPV